VKISKAHRERLVRRTIFTLDEANASLPLVRAIVSDLAKLAQDIDDRRNRLAFLLNDGHRSPHPFYRDELLQIEKDVERDTYRLREYGEELRALGLESSSDCDGTVDFPGLLNGRKVFFCWQLGEPQISFWREPGDPRKQRLVRSESPGRGLGGEVNRN
jgi:hypothetical protein